MGKETKKDVMLRVRITPYVDNELTRIAAEWGCTRSDLVRIVLLNSFYDFRDCKPPKG